MSFLDVSTVRQDDPTMVKLHGILIRAYDDDYEAFAIAGQVAIQKAEIARYPQLLYTWWSILDIAASRAQLRLLVSKMLNDPTIALYHDAIVSILDVPTSELIIEDKKKPTSLPTPQNEPLPTVGARALLWPPRHTLKIRFLDGKSALHKKVERAAQQWVDYANLKLDFGDHPDAEIRVSFEKAGSWSFMGTQSLSVPDPQPNVNFGWLKYGVAASALQQVVLHEFGHVLGLQHEQGNPVSTLTWNKKAVYKAMSGPPNYWTRQQIDENYFKIWAPGYFSVHKVFDPASIMIFPIPREFLRSGEAVG